MGRDVRLELVRSLFPDVAVVWDMHGGVGVLKIGLKRIGRCRSDLDFDQFKAQLSIAYQSRAKEIAEWKDEQSE